MSHAVAWELVADHEPRFSSARERYVWRRRLDQLRSDSEPERLLASWLADRAGRELFHPESPSSCWPIPGSFRPSKHPRSRMSAANVAEGYVFAGDLQLFRRAHLLRPGGSDPNVILHVVADLPEHPVPLLLLAADLAEHDGPRELGRARALIREHLRVSVTLPSMTDAQRQGWSAMLDLHDRFPNL